MEKFFNTAGPNQSDIHYEIDPLSRLDLDEVLLLIRQRKYFVLHAPRQTGKTTCMLALRDYLNREGHYIAVYANVEGGQASREDVKTVIEGFCDIIARQCGSIIKDDRPAKLRDEVRSEAPSSMLASFLSLLSQTLDKPVVLIIDEIDSLVGDSLISVLRQIRTGYADRPSSFPNSIILCGVRDIRDYRMNAGGKELVTGGSAFNIKSESLRLGNFTKEEIRQLYMQHTRQTGQQFDEACFSMIWDDTEGQPWLVNALGYEVTMKMKENRDRSVVIVPDMIYQAKEQIIYRRETHIDQLIDKLKEARVRHVIEPMLANSPDAEDGLISTDDIQYTEDLGLIKRERGKARRIANGIYKEIIPRELTWSTQDAFAQQPQWYERADRSIDMEKLLLDFQQFFRQNADAWIGKFDYREAGAQLLLQAFLQRIVNGGGYIDREYGLGRRRTDLLIRKPLSDSYGGPMQRVVLELKVRRKKDGLQAMIESGIQQTIDYMDLAGSVSEGHLIVFDRSGEHTWEERLWHEPRTLNGHTITVWGM